MAVGAGAGQSQFQSLGFFTGFPEPVMFNAHKSQRHRRKSTAGLEHVKHRRTRSGCYTCRSRRIKCDESRPMCERCKKGKRDCVYPEPASKQASGGQSKETPSTSRQASPATSHGEDEDDGEQDSKLDTIVDDGEAEEAAGETADSDMEGQARQPMASSGTRQRPLPRRSSTASSLAMQRMMATSATSVPGDWDRDTRNRSETPSQDGKSPSPAYSVCTSGSFTPITLTPVLPDGLGPLALGAFGPGTATGTAAPSGVPVADWSGLPQDIQFYLGYFCENITNFHYCLATDAENFFHAVLPVLAMRNESLLYAVVAFAAYHHMQRDPTANMQKFLFYYDRSVKLLLSFLKRKERHNLGTLLTILQLATIEEYLGDWVNLMGHQRAALEVLTQLFTPETAMSSPTSRAILHWYARFDVFVGLRGGFETALPRAWFAVPTDFYKAQGTSEPDNLGWKMEEWSAKLRLISWEMSVLVARRNGREKQDQLQEAEVQQQKMAFFQEHMRILGALHEWKAGLDVILRDAAENGEKTDQKGQPGQHTLLVTDFQHAQPLGEDDIINPYQVGLLFYPPLFAGTLMTCEWQSIVLMHEMQAAQMATAAGGNPGGGLSGLAEEGLADGAEGLAEDNSSRSSSSSRVAIDSGEQPAAALARLAQLAFGACQIFETVERWPASPPGVVIALQASVAIAALFLPRDSRHRMWIRRKFALIESMGYIFPPTMRTRMAELLQDAACAHWWLPDDEGFSPLLQSIRAFADERSLTAVAAPIENLREIRHVFTKMQLVGNGGGSVPEAGTAGQPDDSSPTGDSDSSFGNMRHDKGKGVRW
ncbi:c6 zinc finger domain containing protein [Grosmannia clavigera kw1407]|uniref:C6 zinc finger domain containing protein n=1 Tax=Grosmannia clavigera (strain kw1407 / UAMH 11150) TaxID=655863 RepID=F0XUR9_GROCL|nr:c6 zinc finger domain containing protein [Grosmannia clavigera kw1407]EFW99042.1 c6 zinc finger domain containing protein [Grosmannia clavigera kw1407]